MSAFKFGLKYFFDDELYVPYDTIFIDLSKVFSNGGNKKGLNI